MILFPNCKINLGLRILRKRDDGFHDLETFFFPVPLQDALEVIQSDKNEFTTTGLAIDVPIDKNICCKAWAFLKKDFDLPPIHLHLHKLIPMGAGLGGGSADGAFTLLLLNKKFNLGLSQIQLMQYAGQLGSDCAFFIKNVPSFGYGRGEILEEFPLDLSAYSFVIVNPGIHINTGWAFEQIKPCADTLPIKDILALPVEEWKDKLHNDFEKPVCQAYPEIENIRQLLYENGAIYAAMTGSGSTVFGLFPKEHSYNPSFPKHYFIRQI